MLINLFIDSSFHLPDPSSKAQPGDASTKGEKKGKRRQAKPTQTDITSSYMDQLLSKKKESKKPKKKFKKEVQENNEEAHEESIQSSSESEEVFIQIKPQMEAFGVQVNIEATPDSFRNVQSSECEVVIKRATPLNLEKSSSKRLLLTEPKKKLNKEVKIKFAESIDKLDKDSVSSIEEYIYHDMTSSDRNNLHKIRRYEHRFMKASDDLKCRSPKAVVKREKFSDYIMKNTSYHRASPSPHTHKAREFSPILKRRISEPDFSHISLVKMISRYGQYEDKEYVALTGKIIDFQY